MRIVIRHQTKPTFIAGTRTWVTNAGQATDFGNAIRALHHCVLHELPGEVVPLLEDSDVPLSNNPAPAELPRGAVLRLR